MMKSIVMPKNFDAEKVSFSKPIVNEKYKSKSVYVNYDGKKPLIFKTPTMNCPFGFTVFGEDDGYVKYNLECSFNGMDTNTDMKSFFNALQGLDNSLVGGACKNSLAWFTKPKLSHEVATEFFQSNLRYSIDKDTGQLSFIDAPDYETIKSLNGTTLKLTPEGCQNPPRGIPRGSKIGTSGV